LEKSWDISKINKQGCDLARHEHGNAIKEEKDKHHLQYIGSVVIEREQPISPNKYIG